MNKKDIREWFEAYAVDMGGELNGGSWSISGIMLDEAANAIAKQIKEGVVWEADMFIRLGKAEFNFEPTGETASYLVFSMEGIADPGLYLRLLNRKIAKDGQLVRTTVRLEGENEISI